MTLGRMIGQGNTAEVYELQDKNSQVLKLFYDRLPYEFIKQEYETSRMIHELGIPSPSVYELLKVENKWGITYEKVMGINFTQIVSSNPLLLKRNAYVFAKLQATFHQLSNDQLTPQKQNFTRNILGTDLLGKEEKEKIIQYLQGLPSDNKVCHGDYHPDNIILMDGNPKILDWMTGMSGNPCGDVARTLMILRYSYLPPAMPKMTKFMIQNVRKMFANYYLSSYIKLTNRSKENIDQWLLPVMAARLVEGIPEPEKQLLLQKIKQLLSRF